MFVATVSYHQHLVVPHKHLEEHGVISDIGELGGAEKLKGHEFVQAEVVVVRLTRLTQRLGQGGVGGVGGEREHPVLPLADVWVLVQKGDCDLGGEGPRQEVVPLTSAYEQIDREVPSKH